MTYFKKNIIFALESMGASISLAPTVGFSSSVSLSVKNTITGQSADMDVDTKTGYGFALEVGVDLASFGNTSFEVNPVVEWNKFLYEGTDESTSILNVFLMPKIRQHILPSFSVWGGVGLGAEIVFLNSDLVNQFALSKKSGISFSFSPRVGMDLRLSQAVLLGSYFGYTSTSYSTDIKPNNVKVGELSIDFSRILFGIRLGVIL